MKFIADFHIHSKYSRATSQLMDIENLSRYAHLKGVKLLGTGDFTHPLWLVELKSLLKEESYGIFSYNNVNFILTAEVSNIFKYDGKVKKIHNLIFLPSFESVEKLNKVLNRWGDLSADGRATLSLSCEDLVKIVLDINNDAFIIPAHVWTPWFSLFGSNAGFDSVIECFGKESKNIHALETGLSSDPKMNWMLSSLDRYTLISNSDSHSPLKIAREANFFDTQMSYKEIILAIKNKDKRKFLYTIEFFPQEGKYHYDGHRNCDIRLSPQQTQELDYICPVCGKRLTVGVMHRILELADREEGFMPQNAIPYKSIVPLIEIIGQIRQKNPESESVKREYLEYVTRVASEFEILLEVDFYTLAKELCEELAVAILNMRQGKVKLEAGYDGVYGKVEVILEKEEQKVSQLRLF